MGWAHIWHLKIRDEYRRQWLLSSPHALAEYRVNTPASNMPAFYEAFHVKPGDKLYREPATRASIW
jgi:predicted metalloendopeptidase